jgi:hypothetical protein
MIGEEGDCAAAAPGSSSRSNIVTTKAERPEQSPRDPLTIAPFRTSTGAIWPEMS